MLDLEMNEGLTFDDVLLLPRYSQVLAGDTDTGPADQKDRTQNPLLSAAMDTVTEARAAIVMAQEGGLGIIHKNMTVEAQAAAVLKVKKFESGMVVDPVTVEPGHKLIDVLQLMRRRKISGMPVTSGNKLVGILTNRDIRFEKNLDQKVSALMTPRDRLVTVREGITLEESKQLLHKHKIEKLLVVDDSDRLVGLITLKDIEKTEKHPLAVKDEMGRLRVGAAVGVGPAELKRCEKLLWAGADVICVDTAHGHSQGRDRHGQGGQARLPDAEVLAGNVGTGDGAKALIEAGADAVKVGMARGRSAPPGSWPGWACPRFPRSPRRPGRRRGLRSP